jgi:hypothetical protein
MENEAAKGAKIFLKDGVLYFQSTASLVNKAYVGYDKITVLSVDSSIASIGETVKLTFDSYAIDAPVPEKYSDLLKPLIKRAKQKSWLGFVSRAKLVIAWFDEKSKEIVFEPTKNNLNRGFSGLLKSYFRVPSTSTDEEIGQAVLKALELCE